MIKFTILGEPQSKARPRFYHNGRFVQTYTPEQTVSYENLVKLSYMQQCSDEDGNAQRLNGAIRAEIRAFFQIPKSTTKKKHDMMADGKIRPVTVRKDADNVAKGILDALNGIAYDDDRQIVELLVYKFYSETPKAVVFLEEIK